MTPSEVQDQAIYYLVQRGRTRGELRFRLGHEPTVEGFQFLKEILCRQRKQPLALMNWIEGAIAELEQPAESDPDEGILF